MIGKNLLVILLVTGIVLVGLGMFGKFGSALIGDPWDPNPPIGDPGSELALDNYIAWIQAMGSCNGGSCQIDVGNPHMLGRYVGGYLISFRTCDRYTYDGDNNQMVCNDTVSGEGGRFASGFGILITRYGNNRKKPAIILPLEVGDLPESIRDQLTDYDIPETELVWVQYNLTNLEPSNYRYEFAGLIGGNPPNSPNCDEANDICGRVFLEHLIQVVGPQYDYDAQTVQE